MDIKDIQKDYDVDLRSVSFSVRTTKQISDFMKKENISPTKLFNVSAKEIMDNYNNKNGKKN